MKRYNQVRNGTYEPRSEMVEETDGDYVLWEDVERIMSKRELITDRLAQLLLALALIIAGLGLFIWLSRGCGSSYDIVTIDGCEYIGTRWSSHRTLVHKANCPNHRSAP